MADEELPVEAPPPPPAESRLAEHPAHRGGIGYYLRGEESTKGFFALAGVKPIPSQAKEVGPDGSERIRCDSAAYGPYGFHVWDEVEGVCNCGRTDQPEPVMGHHTLTLANIDFVTVVIESLPHGYILYFECNDPAVEEEACEMRHSDCARTLQELFRLMVEWDYCYEAFGNREPVCVSAHGVLEDLALPDGIRDWLLSTVPAQKVARFLAGDADARLRLSGVPDMSDEFDLWVTDKIMHSGSLGTHRV